MSGPIIDHDKLFEDDCRLLRQRIAIQQQAMRRPRIYGNLIRWEPWEPPLVHPLLEEGE